MSLVFASGSSLSASEVSERVCARSQARLAVVDVVLARTETMSTLRAAFRPASGERPTFGAAHEGCTTEPGAATQSLEYRNSRKSLCRLEIHMLNYVILKTPDYIFEPPRTDEEYML